MREHFRLDPEVLYLNSGSHSLVPARVMDAVQREQRDYERNPTYHLFHANQRVWEAQRQTAEFLRGDPEDFFLRANVTWPLNQFILETEFPKNRDEIWYGDLEYGAIVNIARYRAERDGLRLRTIALPATRAETAGMTPEHLAEHILKQIGPKAGMVILSHVMTATGLVAPIELLAGALRERGVLFVVDGAHAPGALDLDFSGPLSAVDYYAGNLHKWVMGPKGTAFGWVGKHRQESFRPAMASWTTFELDHPYKSFGAQTHFARRMLMPGCHDFAPFFALKETYEFWREQGVERIRARMRAKQEEMEDLIAQELGWESFSPVRGALRGPLLAFRIPAHMETHTPFELMLRIFRERGLQVLVSSVRDRPFLRLTPHVYTSSEDLRRGVQILKEIFEEKQPRLVEHDAR